MQPDLILVGKQYLVVDKIEQAFRGWEIRTNDCRADLRRQLLGE